MKSPPLTAKKGTLARSQLGVVAAMFVGSFLYLALLLVFGRGEGEFGIVVFPPTWDAATRLQTALAAVPNGRLIAVGERLPTVTLSDVTDEGRAALRRAGAWFILFNDGAAACL
ncbi:hypothetical protein ACFSM5_18905 [Lacibacterium aquatile]|uniref:DUF4350 domain-containing protein n=1 Tax=Lacibacterium aquatile TaxID=1168082 RepID=A0ABW5DZY3_9PROT